MDKIIHVIGGLNGSGKTTFAETILVGNSPSFAYLNPDLIAQGLGSNFNISSLKAGRILLTQINQKISNGESFAFESTLSGLTYTSILTSAKVHGYKIIIYFLYVQEIETNIIRIDKRVSEGGHFIPKATVERRYKRCLENFWNLYRLLADEWFILNNTDKVPTLFLDSKQFNDSPSDLKLNLEKKFLGGCHD